MASALRIMYSMPSQSHSVTAVRQSGTFRANPEASCLFTAPADPCSDVAAAFTSCNWAPSIGHPQNTQSSPMTTDACMLYSMAANILSNRLRSLEACCMGSQPFGEMLLFQVYMLTLL